MAKRETIDKAVRLGLNYCCLFAFFSLYKDTALIARRLGFSERAIRKHKAAFAAGQLRCYGRPGCVADKLDKIKASLALIKSDAL